MHNRTRSPRVLTAAALIVIVSAITFASPWSQALSLLGFASAESSQNIVEAAPATFYTVGTCDTAGPIEVESTLPSGPTAYATLNAAVAAINAGTHQGTITVEVCGNSTETASTSLAASGAGSALYTSISMKPIGAWTISGAIPAGSPLLEFNGADNVTIDGVNSGGNSLVISNTTASATSGTSTFRFIADATNNTVTNSSILGSPSMAMTTNGGVIFFSTSTTNGNDNNTISNNNIGPAGVGLPSKAIYGNGSTTSVARANSGIVISGNNIFDYYLSGTHAAIYTNDGNTDWTISNNKFYQSASRTFSASTGSVIFINGSTIANNNNLISGNTIGFANSGGTGTYTIVGISGSVFIPINISAAGTTTATSIQGNTIAGIAMSGASSGTNTSAPFRAIYVGAGLTTIGDVTGNTIGSQSATGSITYTSSSTSASDVIGMFNFGSSNWTTNNNTIGGITASNSSTGAANIYGLRVNTGSSVTWSCQNNIIGGNIANSIQSTSTATGTTVQGIKNDNPIGTISGNTVRNLSAAGGTGTTTTASVIGIGITSAANQTISQNTIHTLTNTNSTAASVVTGIQFTGSTTNVVERNLIYNLTSATNSASAEINGIRVAGGTTQYRNNMIALGAGVSNAIGTAATNSSTTGIVGINESLGTNQFFHNSVYIGGTASAGSGPSFAFNGVQTTNTRSFRDNIFQNSRTNGGATGKHYAIKINGTAANPTGLTINNNVYFANGASGAVFGFFNSADVANLAAWKTAVGQDAASFEANPQFNDPTNATPDLHLHPTNPTIAEGNGADVGVTLDYDGQTRSGLTPVDIGADAGNFAVAGDVSAPGVTYTALGNTTSAADRTLSATITDNVGVTAARVYFRKNTGTYSSNACSLTSGTATNGVYDCVIGASGLGLIAGDAVQYFVVAQDAASNIGSNPSGAAGTSVSSITTFPTTPSSYTILATISGTKTVGSGGDYATLTAAIAAVNAAEVTGPVVLSLTDATYTTPAETFPLVLNANGGSSATNTITIRPAASNVASISGSSASCILTLNGADYVTVDGSNSGGTDRSLTISNTNTAATTASVCIVSNGTGAGATNNTVKNTNIAAGTNQATGTNLSFGIYSGGSGTMSITNDGVDNDTNAYTNNYVTSARYGIWIRGGASNANDGNSVTGNLIGPAAFGATEIGRGGIVIQHQNSATISQNEVRFVGGNFANRSGFGKAIGIGVGSETGPTPTTTIVTNSTITSNVVHDIFEEQTGSAIGIMVGNSAAAASANTISNNVIHSVSANGTFGDHASGIAIAGGNGDRIVFNSVSLTGDIDPSGTTTSTQSSVGIRVVSSTPVNLQLTNNISSVNVTSNTATLKHYAVVIPSSTYNWGTGGSNYNDWFANTASAQSVFGGTGTTVPYTDIATIAAWRLLATTPTMDANSVAGNPQFISDTNLHINTALTTPVESAGTPIAGITTDFDGDTRNLTTPDIGADEGTFIAPVTNDVQGTAFIDPTNGGSKLANTAFAPQASFTNNGTASQISVPVQYRICTDGTCTTELYNDSTQTIPTIASGVTSTVTFTSVAGGLPVGVYTIKAKAQLGTDTVPANDEITGTLSVLGPLAGSYDVPGSYSSLTNPGGLFEALNSLGISNNITINIAGDLTGETGSVALNQLTETGAGAGTYTVTIKPTGVARTITSTSTATGLFSLNGADRVTIDGSLSGGADRSLTLINSNTTTSGTTVVGLFSAGIGAGAVNNTIKNTVIQNGAKFEASTTSFNFGIYAGSGASASSADIDNLTIQNNLIQRCNYGIQAFGFTGGALDNLVIQDNVIGGAVTADYIGRFGMALGNATGATVTRNMVRNHLYTAAADGFGILLSTGFVSSSVTRNTVNNLEANNTGGYGMTGIGVSTGNATSNLTIANNFIYDIKGTSWTTGVLADTVVGIRVSGTNTGGVNIWHNSVNLFGNYAGASGSATVTAALMVTATTPTNLDVRNNIFANTFDNTAGTGDKSYAIYTNSANTMFSSINFNDYFVSGSAPGVLGAINSSDATTLGILQTATGQDATSQNVDPQFVSATDLHLSNPANTMVGGATPIAGVTVDYDNDPRPATTPDIGADEIVGFEGGPLAGGSYYNVAIGVGALGGDVTVTNKLFLLGDVNGGGFTLTLGCDASVSGAGASNFIHSGSVRKEYCTTGAFSYPVGTIDNGAEYSPADVTITALGTIPSSLTVRPYDASLSGFDPLGSLSRNWELTETGDLTATLLFTYLDSDVNGDESDYRVWRREGNGSLTNFCAGSPCVDTVNNVIGPATGVTTFSRWTGAGPLAPTAAEVSLGGRVTTSDGRGIKNAVIVLTGNSLPQPKRVVTGPFGYYQFDGLEAGEIYVVTVNSKRFMFSVPSRVVSVPDNVTDVDFIAMPQE